MEIYSGNEIDAIVPPGLAVGEGGQSNTDNERIVVANRSPGTYYVRVYAGQGVAGLPNVDYSLSVSLEGRQYVCVDDGFESNGTFDSATVLGANVVVRGDTEVDGTITNNGQWLCDRNPADVDMFRLRSVRGFPELWG